MIRLIRFISTNFWRIVPINHRINLHEFSTKQFQWIGARRLFFVGQQDTSRKRKFDWKHYSAVPSSCFGLCSRSVDIVQIKRSLFGWRHRRRAELISDRDILDHSTNTYATETQVEPFSKLFHVYGYHDELAFCIALEMSRSTCQHEDWWTFLVYSALVLLSTCSWRTKTFWTTSK